jgi:acyl-CoA synthetase (AMP-forming)/AMP-acid ligase II
MKDIIISGGENISTIEVENTICRHPAVHECGSSGLTAKSEQARPQSSAETARPVSALSYTRRRLRADPRTTIRYVRARASTGTSSGVASEAGTA